MTHITKHNNFDVSRLSISKVGQKHKLFYDDKPFHLVLPELTTPFGASYFKGGEVRTYIINLNVTDEIKQLFKEIDDKVSNLLQGKLTNGLVKTNKNTRYPDYIQLKLREGNGSFIAHFYDEKKEVVDVTPENVETFLPRNSSVKSIVLLDYVWNMGDKTGITMYPEQFLLTECKKITPECLF